MTKTPLPENLEAYEQAFHKLMQKKYSRFGMNIKDRCQRLAFAIADPRCPLHFYFDNPASTARVAFLVAEKKSPPKQVSTPVRDAILQLSHKLGLLYLNGGADQRNVRFQLQRASKEQYDDICSLRLTLELKGWEQLHLMSNLDRKQRIVTELREANLEVKNVAIKCELAEAETWEDKVSNDPDFADHAHDFFVADCYLHSLPLRSTSQGFTADTLTAILERAQLFTADRFLTLKRVAHSIAEHDKMIEAVARTPSEESLQAIVDAVEEQIENSKKHFCSCLKGESGQK